MKLLKVFFSLVPLTMVFLSIAWHQNTFDVFPMLTWFGLGIIATLSFVGIIWTNGAEFNLGDLLPGLLLSLLGIFSALMVGVIGLASLGDSSERAEYMVDQALRETRSGVFNKSIL